MRVLDKFVHIQEVPRPDSWFTFLTIVSLYRMQHRLLHGKGLSSILLDRNFEIIFLLFIRVLQTDNVLARVEHVDQDRPGLSNVRVVIQLGL